jgi:DNA-binding winged helix-turn-helix (wHTH) protein
VHLLRSALGKAGQDKRLIQTHRRKGIRLALKHQPAPMIESGQE